MDFIVNLPMTPLGFDGIFTIVDRFSRLVRFIPIRSEGVVSMKTSIYSNEKIRKQLNFEFIPIKDSVKDSVVYFNQLTD